MYRQFYHLDRMPFENSPDTGFLYLPGHHKAVLAALTYGVRSNKELILVTGDVGTGKTTLIQALLASLAPDRFAVHIQNPQAGFDGIMHHLARHLSIHANGTAHPLDLGAKIRFRLEQASRGGMRGVLIIDEAHLLEEECLERLQSLTDHVNRDRNRIQIVLAGQHEIFSTLGKASLAPLKQKIAVSCSLEAMAPEDVREYIAHRLRTAGSAAALFDRKAGQLIWEKSGGAPRAVNRICDNALLAGYTLGARKIDVKIVERALAAIDVGQAPASMPSGSRRNGLKRALAVAAALLLTLLLN
jgi:general secretion pathway protein A